MYTHTISRDNSTDVVPPFWNITSMISETRAYNTKSIYVNETCFIRRQVVTPACHSSFYLTPTMNFPVQCKNEREWNITRINLDTLSLIVGSSASARPGKGRASLRAGTAGNRTGSQGTARTDRTAGTPTTTAVYLSASPTSSAVWPAVLPTERM